MEQLRKEVAKNFPLESTIAMEKQSDCRKPKTIKELIFQDKLAIEKAKTIKDPDPPYNRKFQKALDNFIRQVNNVFLTKSLIYTIKQDKCRYVRGFLCDISADDWEAYNHWNLKINNF